MSIRFGKIDFKDKEKISEVSEQLEKITSAYEKLYVEIMSIYESLPPCEYKHEADRTMAIFRTHLEMSSMYVNKTIVLMMAGFSNES